MLLMITIVRSVSLPKLGGDLLLHLTSLEYFLCKELVVHQGGKQRDRSSLVRLLPKCIVLAQPAHWSAPKPNCLRRIRVRGEEVALSITARAQCNRSFRV